MGAKTGSLRLDSKTLASVVAPVLVAALFFGITVSMYPNLPILGDPVVYHMTAQRWVSTGKYAHGADNPGQGVSGNADVTPGYATFLAGIYAAMGQRSQDPTTTALSAQPLVEGAQFGILLMTVAVIAACGLLVDGPGLALACGLLAAFYAPFGWASSVALGETLATFLLSGVLLLSLLMTRSGVRLAWPLLVGYGVAMGALTMVRPAFVLWAPFPFAYLALGREMPLKPLMAKTAVALAGLLLALVPWTVRNYVVLDRFVPLAENSGRVQFFSTGPSKLSAEEQKVHDAALRQGRDRWAAVARYRLAKSLRQNPARLVADRLMTDFRVVTTPWSAVYDVYWAKTNSPNIRTIHRGDFPEVPSPGLRLWLALTRPYHLALLALAVFSGALMSKKRSLWLVASLPLYVVMVHSFTLFISRYFAPAMPAVILLAGAALHELIGDARDKLASR